MWNFPNKNPTKNKLLKSKRDLGVEEHESVEGLLKWASDFKNMNTEKLLQWVINTKFLLRKKQLCILGIAKETEQGTSLGLSYKWENTNL